MRRHAPIGEFKGRGGGGKGEKWEITANQVKKEGKGKGS